MAFKSKFAVQGHDVPKAHLTKKGWAWLAVYLGLPVLVLGNVLDFFFQWALGWCIGIWCIV